MLKKFQLADICCRIDEQHCNLPCSIGRERCGGANAISVYFTGVYVPKKDIYAKMVDRIRIVFILTLSGKEFNDHIDTELLQVEISSKLSDSLNGSIAVTTFIIFMWIKSTIGCTAN